MFTSRLHLPHNLHYQMMGFRTRRHCVLIARPGMQLPPALHALSEKLSALSAATFAREMLDQMAPDDVAAIDVLINGSRAPNRLFKPQSFNNGFNIKRTSTESKIEDSIRQGILVLFILPYHYHLRLTNPKDPLCNSGKHQLCIASTPVDQSTLDLVNILATDAAAAKDGVDYRQQPLSSRPLPTAPLIKLGKVTLIITPHEVSTQINLDHNKIIHVMPEADVEDALDSLGIEYKDIRRILNRGQQRWEAICAYDYGEHLLRDYWISNFPDAREKLATRDQQNSHYKATLGAEVLLALGAVGERKRGQEQQRIGPFSHRAILAMANMADQITHQSQQEELLTRPRKVTFKTKHWVEIALKDEKGIAVENQPYWIKTPDGATHAGKTTVKGTARVSEIDEGGECQICFPSINVLKDGSTPPPKTESGPLGTYVVQQGDTLLRIAKANGLNDGRAIYNYPLNKSFRKKRPNPNVIFPGDKLTLPEPADTPFTERMNTTHRFVLMPAKEMFRVTLKDIYDNPLQATRAILTVGGQEIDMKIGSDGLVEAELMEHTETEATLKVFLNSGSSKPTHSFTVQLAHLDPIDTLSGVQARCNNLGFECGTVDGIMGENTRKGVKAFQKKHKLAVDGDPGPKTKAKLEEVYGF